MQQACNTYHSYHNEYRELETSLNDIKKRDIIKQQTGYAFVKQNYTKVI